MHTQASKRPLGTLSLAGSKQAPKASVSDVTKCDLHVQWREDTTGSLGFWYSMTKIGWMQGRLVPWRGCNLPLDCRRCFFSAGVVVLLLGLEGALRLSQIAAQEASEGRAFDEVPLLCMYLRAVLIKGLLSFSGLLSRSSTLPSKRSALCFCRRVSGVAQVNS